jgi:copper transport protein
LRLPYIRDFDHPIFEVALNKLSFRLLFHRRSARAAVIALCLTLAPVVAYGGRALLHATLLRSVPRANAVLKTPPESIRLVFSEAVVPELSQIALVRRDSLKVVLDSLRLPVANDPRDVHTLVGRVSELRAGRYTVMWRILSADAHPISGNFAFVVQSGSPEDTVPTASSTARISNADSGDTLVAPPSTSATADARTIPVLASLLRGTGLGAIMAGLGLLFFAVTAGERRHLAPGRVIVYLITLGAVLLVAHMFAWLVNVSPTRTLSTDFIASAFGSSVGRTELLRVALALLAFLAIALARRETLALVFGAACLVVSGAVGHPAAIHPLLSIPAKIAHLLSASLWLGGLLWLVWLSRCDDIACRAEARRVSSIALITVIAIFLTGSLETLLFLNSPRDLFYSAYGRLVLAKVVGLAILVGYGAYNKLGLLPRLDDSDTPRRLNRSVSQELVIVTLVILIGGFLAYVPTPPPPPSSLSVFTGRPQ